MTSCSIHLANKTYAIKDFKTLTDREKHNRRLYKDLIKNYALPDHRGEEVLQKIWAEKVEYYEKARDEQEREFSEYGYLKQFSDEP